MGRQGGDGIDVDVSGWILKKRKRAQAVPIPSKLGSYLSIYLYLFVFSFVTFTLSFNSQLDSCAESFHAFKQQEAIECSCYTLYCTCTCEVLETFSGEFRLKANDSQKCHLHWGTQTHFMLIHLCCPKLQAVGV